MNTPSVSSDVQESYIFDGEKARIAHLKLCNTFSHCNYSQKLWGHGQNSWGVVKIPGGVVKIPGVCGYCPRCNSRKVGTYVKCRSILNPHRHHTQLSTNMVAQKRLHH